MTETDDKILDGVKFDAAGDAHVTDLPAAPERYIAIWREPGVAVLDGVQFHRAMVPTGGLGMLARFLDDLAYATEWPKVGRGVGFTAGSREIEASAAAVVVTFTLDGPEADYPCGTEGLRGVVLEAHAFFVQLAMFEQGQMFGLQAQQEMQARQRMAQLMNGVPRH